MITTALMVVVSTLAAFAFARLEFRGKNLAFTLFLSLMMIPNELVVITNFVTITNLKPAQYLHGSDTALRHLGILHLSVERKFCPGTG